MKTTLGLIGFLYFLAGVAESFSGNALLALFCFSSGALCIGFIGIIEAIEGLKEEKP